MQTRDLISGRYITCRAMNEGGTRCIHEGIYDVSTARHIFVLGCLAQKASNHKLARMAWSKYITIRSNDPRGYHNLGICLEALGQNGAALGRFEQAFALQPSMVEAGANAAGLLIRIGHSERASELCFRALERDPESSAALYNLNTALRKAGRLREAVDFSWRWILERLPKGVRTRERFLSTAKSASSGLTSATEEALLSHTATVPTASEERGPSHSVTDNGSGVPCRRDDGVLTVACVKWGTKYGLEYVERLARGVHRNLDRPYQFVCFTDDVEALLGMDGVQARPLGEHCARWQGWWNKAFLFSREADLDGRVIYIDLDTVICGSLNDVAGFSGGFAALSAASMENERRPTGINSSVMCWDSRDDRKVSALHELLAGAYNVVTACIHKFDHWLEMTMDHVEMLQEAFPGQILEYAAVCRGSTEYSDVSQAGDVREIEGRNDHMNRSSIYSGSGSGNLSTSSCCTASNRADHGIGGGFIFLKTELEAVPSQARVICFPLQPKPHELVEQPWIQRSWLGVEEISVASLRA